jgi:hypothetical protein
MWMYGSTIHESHEAELKQYHKQKSHCDKSPKQIDKLPQSSVDIGHESKEGKEVGKAARTRRILGVNEK